jgi:hypothetical protein
MMFFLYNDYVIMANNFKYNLPSSYRWIQKGAGHERKDN